MRSTGGSEAALIWLLIFSMKRIASIFTRLWRMLAIDTTNSITLSLRNGAISTSSSIIDMKACIVFNCFQLFSNIEFIYCFRGIGGLFFDDIDYPNQKEAFDFVKSCADAIIPCYIPIVKNNVNKGYSYSDRQWQLLRRGRFVSHRELSSIFIEWVLYLKIRWIQPNLRQGHQIRSFHSRRSIWEYTYVTAFGRQMGILSLTWTRI